ncbi:MAG: dienelactone hydrolase family protein [Balneolaceae bacterium]|nr:dienelactone hydrolase family protein [Balneolaceae bacterium]
MILFNPVIDNGPGGYGYDRIGDAYKDFSPLHNIKKGAPPTILFLGTNDDLIPVETAKYYQKVMENVDSRCELHLYDEQEHGFFNYRNFEYYKKTVSEADSFLQSLGYLNKEPGIAIE